MWISNTMWTLKMCWRFKQIDTISSLSCTVSPVSSNSGVGAELDEVNGITKEAAYPGFNYQILQSSSS